jgi:DNA helicase-2/ATP-dependent DNA helicase PcrA
VSPAARADAGAPVSMLAAAAAADPILADLNDEQRAAVTHGEGPMLIVAGAGTGKTAVITRRIAWLIASKRARPEEILALTFTEKAAAEMESRVDVLVPYGYVGASIATFHAFGDRLVREYGIELGLTRDLRVCTRAEVLVFLREHLFDLGLERYLPLGNPDKHLDALLTLFDRARDEDVTPERYHAFAEALAAGALDDPETRDRVDTEREKARVYARYTRLMLESGRVDFSDQLALALRLLRERPRLLRQLQERYRYVLVDEFQDTNHVQFEIVKLLAGTRANLTVVGDDDQSIYRFRGAKVANLLAFLETYPGARETLLVRNYRSRQNLLDSAYRLIRNNDPDRLEAQRHYDKRLIADTPGLGTLERLEFATATEEADAVAARIADDIAAGRRRPVAILARAHDHLAPFLTALKTRGVAFHQTGDRGLYAREEVRLCLSMLRAIATPDDSLSVFHLLGSAIFGCDAEDLARLSSWANHRNRSLRQVIERLDDERLGFAPAAATREVCARFVQLARQLAEVAVRRPTSEVLYAFVHASGFLGQLAARDTLEAEEQVKNLSKLFSITQRIGAMLDHDRVESFIRYLDLLIDAGDDPAAAEVDVEVDAVHALTVHNAKGLEFPVVYLVSMVEERFPAVGRGDPVPLPDELIAEPPTHGDARLEEERRLFYVGMTRAKEALFLTHAVDYGGKIRRKMSRFVAEALAITPGPAGRRKLDPREAIERHAPTATPPTAQRAPMRDEDPLRLSSSRIDDYLTCPLKYRYAHEVQVPLTRDPNFMYGEAVHHAIRHYYKARLLGHPVDAEEVVRVFEEAWSSEGFISREHEERRLERGRGALRAFVRREAAASVKPVQIEQEFKFKRGNNVITGRWDRIDDRRGDIVIVDFKTSEVVEQKDADTRAKNSLRDEQLGLYALAYREMRGVVPAAVELQFVESGLVGRAAVATKHLDRALERIDTAAAGIRAADFAARPDYNACRNCPYSNFCPFTAAGSAS